MKVSLVGCKRYTRGGRFFEAGMVYTVADALGELLLDSEDDMGRPLFKQRFDTPNPGADSGKQSKGNAASSARSDAQKKRRDAEKRKAKAEADKLAAAEAAAEKAGAAKDASGADSVEAEPDPELNDDGTVEFEDMTGERDTGEDQDDMFEQDDDGDNNTVTV